MATDSMSKAVLAGTERVENLSAAFVVRIDKLEKLVQEREAALLKDAKSAAAGEGSTVVSQVLRNKATADARQFRRTLAGETERERTERLREILAIEAGARKLAPLFETPVQVLSRHGLGSPERSRYSEQLRNAGPRELANHAELAQVNGDRVLAAAVLSRLDAQPTKQRLVDATDFASQLVGEEFQEVQRALARTRIAAQRAVNSNRAFERGRVDSLATISLALEEQKAAQK